jgi:hypothetical protein
LAEQWEVIIRRFNEIHVCDIPDVVFWGLNANKKFSTKSMYEFLEKDLVGPNNKLIWKTKIPLKIQIFMWQTFRNAIPTWDNLKRRKWPGNPTCSFCLQRESVDHLFFSCSVAKVVWGSIGKVLGTDRCPASLWQAVFWFHAFLPGGKRFYMLGIAAVCWAIWTIRNKTTFDSYNMRSPSEAVFTMCSFVMYWAGLQTDEDKAQVLMGAGKLMEMATELARQTRTEARRGCSLIGD